MLLKKSCLFVYSLFPCSHTTKAEEESRDKDKPGELSNIRKKKEKSTFPQKGSVAGH